MSEELFIEPALALSPEPPLERPPAAVAIRAARAKLKRPPRTGSVWPVVAAAALAAASALMLAAAVIVGPPSFGPDAPHIETR